MVTATAAQHWKASRQLLHLMYLPVQVGSLVIPLDKRPGPFGRNGISARQVLAKRMVGIHIRSDDGMGFPSTTVPLTLSSQQRDVTNTNGSITLWLRCIMRLQVNDSTGNSRARSRLQSISVQEAMDCESLYKVHLVHKQNLLLSLPYQDQDSCLHPRYDGEQGRHDPKHHPDPSSGLQPKCALSLFLHHL
jgi:hypothetical protein